MWLDATDGCCSVESMDTIRDDIKRIIKYALDLGADFVDARVESYEYELFVYDKDRLKEQSFRTTRGAGFRVVYKGAQGYASTTRLDVKSLRSAVEAAFRNARALSLSHTRKVRLAPYPALRESVSSLFRIDPFVISNKEKIEVIKNLVSVAQEVKDVESAIARLGLQRDERLVINSEGLEVAAKTVLTGVALTAVARGDKSMEYVSDSKSRVAGWEFIESLDLNSLGRSVGELASTASRASTPSPGKYRVVLEPEVVGLLIHEALGHASEADLVLSGASVLQGLLGQRIAVEEISISDDGRHPDGYFVPFDDEGVRKTKTRVVEKGILKSYLTGRAEAGELGVEPTGNSRVMSYKDPLLVRQTNYYIEPGDWKPDEILEAAGDNSIYVTAKGAKGGEVDPGMGTFTFGVGISWTIENGEPAKPLRGVSIGGFILDVLKKVEAVGRDLKVTTSVFGGCGKGGQLVRVGDGGPHLLVGELIVGGR